jgi:hypothetical protein
MTAFCRDAAFPLILTFSRREKEQPLMDFRKSVRFSSSLPRSSGRRTGNVTPSPSGRAGVRENASLCHMAVVFPEPF